MSKKQKHQSSKVAEPATAYLSKRTLKRALSKATRNISEDALHRKGYVITVRNGWVVKEDSNGKQTRISKLDVAKSSGKISLD